MYIKFFKTNDITYTDTTTNFSWYYIIAHDDNDDWDSHTQGYIDSEIRDYTVNWNTRIFRIK